MTQMDDPAEHVDEHKCLCAPPVQKLADEAQELYQRTNGHNAVLTWNVAMAMALFGVVVARSIAEKKHYAGFFSQTHRQCPVHDVLFWPNVAEEPESTRCDRNKECARKLGHEGDCVVAGDA